MVVEAAADGPGWDAAGTEELASCTFAPVRVVDFCSGGGPSFEVVLGNGMTVRVPVGFQARGVEALALGRGVMWSLPPSVKIHVCTRPTNLHLSYDGLAGLAMGVLGQDPLSGHCVLQPAEGRGQGLVLGPDGVFRVVEARGRFRPSWLWPWAGRERGSGGGGDGACSRGDRPGRGEAKAEVGVRGAEG